MIQLRQIRFLKCIIFIIFIAYALTPHAEKISSKGLVINIFAATPVLGVDIFKKDMSSYSDDELRNVLEAKSILNKFLDDIQHQNNSVETLLMAPLREKYPNSISLFGKITTDEAILEFKIFDFDFSKYKKTLFIRYDLTTTNEGVLCIYQHSATMTLDNRIWKVATLN